MPKTVRLGSNLSVYRTIVEEAAAKSQKSLEAHRTPKPDGQAGFVLHHDPDRVSFKEAMIAIAFGGIYLEALMALVACEAKKAGRRYISNSKKLPRYGGKLQTLGVKSEELIEEANRFNDARDDLIHEKTYEVTFGPDGVGRGTAIPLFVAQEEAAMAVKLIRQVTDELRRIHPSNKHGNAR